MLITKYDPYKMEEVTVFVPITPTEYYRIVTRYESDESLEDIVPHLPKKYKEYLISGLTPTLYDYEEQQYENHIRSIMNERID